MLLVQKGASQEEQQSLWYRGLEGFGLFCPLHPADVIPFNSSGLAPEGCADILSSTTQRGRWKHNTNPPEDPTILTGPTCSVPFIQRKGCYDQGLPCCGTMAAAQPESGCGCEEGGTRDTGGASRAELCYCRRSNAVLG